MFAFGYQGLLMRVDRWHLIFEAEDGKSCQSAMVNRAEDDPVSSVATALTPGWG